MSARFWTDFTETEKIMAAVSYLGSKNILTTDYVDSDGRDRKNDYGMHVHVDITDFTEAERLALMKTWISVEKEMLKLIKKNRRESVNGGAFYCSSLLSRKDILEQINRGIIPNERFIAMTTHTRSRKTAEFRCHHSTFSFEEVKEWVNFCRSVVEFSKTHGFNKNLINKFAATILASKVEDEAIRSCSQDIIDRFPVTRKHAKKLNVLKRDIILISASVYFSPLTVDEITTLVNKLREKRKGGAGKPVTRRAVNVEVNSMTENNYVTGRSITFGVIIIGKHKIEKREIKIEGENRTRKVEFAIPDESPIGISIAKSQKEMLKYFSESRKGLQDFARGRAVDKPIPIAEIILGEKSMLEYHEKTTKAYQ